LDIESPKSGGFDIHHSSESWMSRALGVPADKLDDCPGIPMRRQPDATFDVKYKEDFGHDPVYHGSAGGPDTIANRLAQIRGSLDRGAIDVKRMVDEVKDLYESPPYNSTNMWPVTRDWLKANVANSSLIPD
jgi:hypothetical protein